MEKSKKPNDPRDILTYKKKIADARSYYQFWATYAKIDESRTESIDKQPAKRFDDRRELLNELSDIFLYLKTDIKKANSNKEDNNNKDDLDLIEITKKLVDELYPQSEKNKKENIISTETKSKQQNNQDITKVLEKYYNTITTIQLDALGVHGREVLLNQIKSFDKLDNDQKIKLLGCMKHVKNNKVTDDDLLYINLLHSELKLTINDDYDSRLQKALKLCSDSGMTDIQIEPVIKNISKKKIDNPQKKKAFASAIISVLKRQIDELGQAYKQNDYQKIYSLAEYKSAWKTLITELKKKDLITEDDKDSFEHEIDRILDLKGFVAVGEWILAVLGSIVTIGILPGASKGIRKTLHSPFRSRQARHLIKNVKRLTKSTDVTHGIFSILRYTDMHPGPLLPNLEDQKE